MKISENWVEKIVMGLQAAIVVVYVWFTINQEIKQKQKSAKRLAAVHEKEATRYAKARFKQKRRNLNIAKRK